jgi:hypothetical protein
MKIVDEILEPYSIIVDGDNYVLAIEKEYEKPTGEKYTVLQNATYFYDVRQLIKKVIKIKIQETEGVTDLEGFLKLYNEIWNKIDNKLKTLD